MKIFQLIEIDMEAERARVERCKLTKRQKAALFKLYDLFEAGEWQACLNLVNDKNVFWTSRRNPKEYPEVEHIGIAVSDVLRQLGCENFYTQAELLKQAAERLNLQSPEKALQ